MKRITIQDAVFIYTWYDKENERHYKVTFTEDGDITDAYSFSKDEEGPGKPQETFTDVDWGRGVLIIEKALKEDVKLNLRNLLQFMRYTLKPKTRY